MNNKHIEEAIAAGLTLLSNADESFGTGYQNYKKYKYDKCGHVEFLQPTHVRRKNISCKVCISEKISEHASSIGLEFVSDGEDKRGSKIFRILKCNHLVTLTNGNLFDKKDDYCKECFEEKLKEEALSQGLVLTGKSDKNGIYRRYSFVDCNHTQEITHPCVRVGRFQCQTCKDDNYAVIASREGLEYLGSPICDTHSDHKRSYKLPCGHIRDFRMSHVAESRWQCDICEDSFLNKPSKIYLFEMYTENFSWLKLGFARDLQSRVWTYGLIEGVRWVIVKHIDLELGSLTIKEEKQLHRKFRKQVLDKNTMKSFMKNGHTECYPIELKDVLANELNLIQERYNG